MQLLSKISVNLTVEFLRAKKQSVLRSEGFAWVPVSWSFDKLCEVGVLSYLNLHFF